MKLKISEKAIEKQIINYLRARGIWCTKIDNTGIYDAKLKKFRMQKGTYKLNGLPDIIALHNGEFFAFEVKSAKGKLSAAQESVLRDLNHAGGTAHVVRSVDDVAEILKQSFPEDCFIR